MPLTPEDVRNKQFTTVRLREGYDEDEVDAFLDEVETELTRLLRENQDLRAKLQAATRAAAAAPARPPARQERPEPPQITAARPLLQPAPPPAASPPMPAAPRMPAPVSGGDSAARVLALAQQTADQAIAEARSEASKIIVEARSKAEVLERDAEDKHQNAMSSLDGQRIALERRVEELRAFERDYRSRLRSYLEGQMRQLESHPENSLPSVPAPAPAPPLPAGVAPAMSPARAGVPHPYPVQQAAPSRARRGFLLDDDTHG